MLNLTKMRKQSARSFSDKIMILHDPIFDAPDSWRPEANLFSRRMGIKYPRSSEIMIRMEDVPGATVKRIYLEVVK